MGRLLWSLILIALGVLGQMTPPNHALWYVSLGVTEWGHWLLIPILLIWWPGWQKTGAGKTAAALAVVAAGLVLMPALKARSFAPQVQREVETFVAAMGHAGRPAGSLVAGEGLAPTSSAGSVAARIARPSPLVLEQLFKGVPIPNVDSSSRMYVKRGEREIEMDIYMPAAQAAAPAGQTRPPVVLVFHGGITGSTWQAGSRYEAVRFNQYLAARGYAVVSADYRLATDAPYPAALDDALAALAEAKRVGGPEDGAQVVVMGRAGGAHLALMTAYASGDAAVRGVVALYPPTDLNAWAQAPSPNAVADSTGWMQTFLGTSAAGPGAALYKAASPMSYAGGATPTLLIHGARDPIVPAYHSERLAQGLRSYQRAVLNLQLPWATHACDSNISGPCGQASLYAVERFLAAVLP
ncbi:MAG: alpha/beta hydrolase [Nitrospiraceae bacterium]